jgi:hypothetical protein
MAATGSRTRKAMVVAAGQAATKLRHRTPEERRRARAARDQDPRRKSAMSLAERQHPHACSACQNSSASADYSENGLCSGCHKVFQTARVLLKYGIATEEELIPTLVFARIAGRAEDQHYKDHYRSGYGSAEESVLSGAIPPLR